MSLLPKKPSIPGSDESLSNIVNITPTAHHNLESTILKAAYISKLENKQNYNSSLIIKLEIITTLVFIAITLLVQFNGSTTEVLPELKTTNNYQQLK